MAAVTSADGSSSSTGSSSSGSRMVTLEREPLRGSCYHAFIQVKRLYRCGLSRAKPLVILGSGCTVRNYRHRHREHATDVPESWTTVTLDAWMSSAGLCSALHCGGPRGRRRRRADLVNRRRSRKHQEMHHFVFITRWMDREHLDLVNKDKSQGGYKFQRDQNWTSTSIPKVRKCFCNGVQFNLYRVPFHFAKDFGRFTGIWWQEACQILNRFARPDINV